MCASSGSRGSDVGRTSLACLIAAVIAPASAGASTSDAINAIQAFDPANEQTFDRLEQVIDAGGVDVAALKRQLGDRDIDRRWAAAYIGHNLARTEADHRALAPLLRDGHPTVRAMAAFALFGTGRKLALPTMIALLRSRQRFMFGEPPLPLAVLADQRLRTLTHANFNFRFEAPARVRRRAIAKWARWSREVRRTLRWDGNAERYRWRRERSRRAPGMADEPVRMAAPAQASPLASSAAVTPNFAGDTGTVTINVQLSGPGLAGNAATIQSALAAAQNYLNGTSGAGDTARTGQCTRMLFRIVVVPSGTNVPGATPIVVTGGVSRGERRSNVRGGGTPAATMNLFAGDAAGPYGGEVIAHELVHVMGLGDEYKNVGSGDAQRTVPYDPSSFMGDLVNGTFQQRHLDALGEKYFGEQNRACERWQLRFPDWQSSLRAHTDPPACSARCTYFLGGVVTAREIYADFWVNRRGRTVTPVGFLPCGKVTVNADCDETGGNSRAGNASPDVGTARCQGSLSWNGGRFETTVSGSVQSADSFRLLVKTDDHQTAAYSCPFDARGQGGPKSYIRGGMTLAGADDFTISAANEIGPEVTLPFDEAANFRRGTGTAVLRRVK